MVNRVGARSRIHIEIPKINSAGCRPTEKPDDNYRIAGRHCEFEPDITVVYARTGKCTDPGRSGPHGGASEAGVVDKIDKWGCAGISCKDRLAAEKQNDIYDLPDR